MKIKTWMLAAALMTSTFAQAATNDLTSLLQQGLFEEEANRNLDAAIANYQSLANAFDKDRQLAATAIFRLGECYRKLGKTNEAIVQYQRIVKEFSDQPSLVTLSRQNVAGLNSHAAASSGKLESVEEVRAHLEKAQMDVAAVDAMSGTNRAAALESFFGTDEIIMTFTRNREALESRLAVLLKTYLPENAIVKDTKQQIQAAQSTIDGRAENLAADAHTWLNAMENAYRQRTNSTQASASRGTGESAIYEAEANIKVLQAQLRQIETNQDQARVFVQQNYPNPVLNTLLGELDLAEQALIKLKTDYTADHPKYQNAQELVKDLSKKVDLQVNGVVNELRNQLASAQSKLHFLQTGQNEVALTAGGGSSGTSHALTTDEEDQEIRRIQAIIQNSPDLINAAGPGNGGETPLQQAATKGHLTVVKYLLDHGADVDAKGQDLVGSSGNTPLFLAASHGHKAVVELLLSHGANPNYPRSALNPAVSQGFSGVVEVLLAYKADVNGRDEPLGEHILQTAVLNDRTNLIQPLLDHGANVNIVDESSNTPLHLAAGHEKINATKILLAVKADVNARNKEGNTPLHEAAKDGNEKIVSLLLDAGASVDAINHNFATPLLLAVRNQRVEAVRTLLAHKANPNLTARLDSDPGFYPPVLLAVGNHIPIITRLLLEAGANPNGDTNSPYRPSFYSLNNSGKDAPDLQVLLEHGADPNAKNRQGQTPLFLTTNSILVHLLIDHKADVNERNKYGETPIMLATGECAADFIKTLVEAGAKTDLQDTNGNTALHYAAYNAQPESVAILLKHKTNPNIQNDQGFTPLDIARAENVFRYSMLGSGDRIPVSRPQFPPPVAPLDMGDNTAPVLSETDQKIVDLLVNAGGLANLPKRDRIEVRRASGRAMTIAKDSHNWNNYRLLEVIATSYRMISQNSEGPRGAFFGGNQARRSLDFPDLKNIVIYRRTDKSAKQTAINVNLEDILNTGDCSRDVWLEWGDVVEIPEADHPLNEMWSGFPQPTEASIDKCITRQVTIKINGSNTTVKLAPQQSGSFNSPTRNSSSSSFMLRAVLDNSMLIRVSSDLSRVKVTRLDPATEKNVEWIVDCTSPNDANLWLRDGDVIEVPEK
jgi:cytohesin